MIFDDVAALNAAKRELDEIVQLLREPERFRRLGGEVPRGVLLIGPPGTGKTLLARAVAGESKVLFFSISASEFIEMFVGVGAACVRDLFEEAKKTAPAIIFIDEIHAVGRSRGAGLCSGHDEREPTLNQLLSEMDGFNRNDQTIVLAATSRPDVLDPALLRPVRFDRRVLVDRPELAARRAILEVRTRAKPLAPDVDLLTLARTTPGFSGADLANLFNEAALGATRRGVDALAPVDFIAAFDKIVLGDPRDAKLDPEEKARVAVHESGRAVFSNGAESDLKEATGRATRMVAHYGMSEQLGPVYFEHQEEHAFLGQRTATATSDVSLAAIEVAARRGLTRALDEASQSLTAHRDAMDRLAAALMDRETFEREDLSPLLGTSPPRSPHAATARGDGRSSCTP